jgi:hypothetical protein
MTKKNCKYGPVKKGAKKCATKEQFLKRLKNGKLKAKKQKIMELPKMPDLPE